MLPCWRYLRPRLASSRSIIFSSAIVLTGMKPLSSASRKATFPSTIRRLIWLLSSRPISYCVPSQAILATMPTGTPACCMASPFASRVICVGLSDPAR